MGMLSYNGVAINYRMVGEGIPIVLIHGLGANLGFWHLDVLLPLVRDYLVAIYDLRGHGRSCMPPHGYTSAHMVKDLRHLMDHLAIPSAHLVGHSYGGVVALHFALLYPQRVISLILADSRVRALQPNNYPTDWPNWPAIRSRLQSLGLSVPKDEPEAGLWVLDQLATPKWRNARNKLNGTPLSIPFSRWGGGNHSAERWAELMHTTTARQDFLDQCGLTRESIASIEHPTLALCGENSPSLPSLFAIGRNLPHCDTEIVPGAGHFFPLTHSKLFIGSVKRFLSRVSEGSICVETR